MPGAVSLDPFIYLSFQCKMIEAKMGTLWHHRHTIFVSQSKGLDLVETSFKRVPVRSVSGKF